MLKPKIKKADIFRMARNAMVESQIRPDGVIRGDVISAFASVPREDFLPDELAGVAYIDDNISADKNHILLAPSVHARMVEALELKGSELVLDIGQSYGYGAAILSSLVSTVMSLATNHEASVKYQKIWEELELVNIVPLSGQMGLGNQEYAPYDCIFIHGAIENVPESLTAQLKVGGRLVCVKKAQGAHIGQAVLVYKTGEEVSTQKVLFEAAAPYLSGFIPKEKFVF